MIKVLLILLIPTLVFAKEPLIAISELEKLRADYTITINKIEETSWLLCAYMQAKIDEIDKEIETIKQEDKDGEVYPETGTQEAQSKGQGE